jgi:hypothetical protein
MNIDQTDLDAVVTAMYTMISGPAGPRDWSKQKQIFHPEARQMRTGVTDGTPWIKIMGLEEYAADTSPFFAQNPFYEVETARKADVFGNIAHVWSVYEARRSPDEAAPERRGINSIQLYRDGERRWWIMSMIWDNERPGLSVPQM